MNKILICKAIEAAKIQKKNEGKKRPSLTEAAEELSNFVDEHEGFQLNERTYRDYYNDAVKLEDNDEDIAINQLKVVNGLCHYLGFENYQEFVASLETNTKDSLSEKIIGLIKTNKVLIGFLLAAVITLVTYNSITKQNWMVWQGDHYVEVEFDAEKYGLNQLKLYNEDRINAFKQIEADCDTEFFDKDSRVRVWYGKNKNKELEYFTSLGLHPETGKSLKPITNYMIEKYICEAYKKKISGKTESL